MTTNDNDNDNEQSVGVGVGKGIMEGSGSHPPDMQDTGNGNDNNTTEIDFKTELTRLFKKMLNERLLNDIKQGRAPINGLGDNGIGIGHYFAALGYTWCIPHLLLVDGFLVNLEDSMGRTALDWALSMPRNDTVEFLKSIGGRPGSKMKMNRTPPYPSASKLGARQSKMEMKRTPTYPSASKLGTDQPIRTVEVEVEKEGDEDNGKTRKRARG